MVKINRMDTINNDSIWIYEAMKNLARFQSEAGFDKTMEKLEAYKTLAAAFFGANEEDETNKDYTDEKKTILLLLENCLIERRPNHGKR